MKKKERDKQQDYRFNIRLTTPAQQELYKNLKHLAVDLHIPLKRLVLETLEERLKKDCKN